jgi:hypothetical protein
MEKQQKENNKKKKLRASLVDLNLLSFLAQTTSVFLYLIYLSVPLLEEILRYYSLEACINYGRYDSAGVRTLFVLYPIFEGWFRFSSHPNFVYPFLYLQIGHLALSALLTISTSGGFPYPLLLNIFAHYFHNWYVG